MTYDRIDDQGFHVTLPDGTSHARSGSRGRVQVNALVPNDLEHPHMVVIGGARDASGLDAQRAILEGMVPA